MMQDFEPTSQAITVLLDLIERESDVRRKRLMILDYRTKSAKNLPHQSQTRNHERIRDSFIPADIRAVLSPFDRVESAEVGQFGGREKTNLAIVTILLIERDMTLRVLGIPEGESERIIGNDRYYFGEIYSKVASRPLSIVIGTVGESKNNECASATSRMFSRFQVDAAILVGIAAGLEDTCRPRGYYCCLRNLVL